MLLFGGETLKDFALAMTVGLIAGAYSSYAIATPIYVIWKTRETRYAKLQRKYGDTVVRWFLNRLPQPVKAVEVEGAASAAPVAANAVASTAQGASVEASAEGSSENATVVAAAQPVQEMNRAANHATHRQKSNRSKSANRKKK